MDLGRCVPYISLRTVFPYIGASKSNLPPKWLETKHSIPVRFRKVTCPVPPCMVVLKNVPTTTHGTMCAWSISIYMRSAMWCKSRYCIRSSLNRNCIDIKQCYSFLGACQLTSNLGLMEQVRKFSRPPCIMLFLVVIQKTHHRCTAPAWSNTHFFWSNPWIWINVYIFIPGVL
jgi:hypothetical protein